MRFFPATFLALFAGVITAIPLRKTSNYIFKMVGPAPKFEIDVASQLEIIFCHDVDFKDCVSGYVAPGLCYAPPGWGVNSIQPSQEVSGVTLFNSGVCSWDDSVLPNVKYPGISDLGDDDFANDVHSFIAY